MGVCGSAQVGPLDKQVVQSEKARSRELEKALAAQHAAENQVHKLLLLGAGESGKSTLFKQMNMIYGAGFSNKERATYISIIHSNIIASMKTLIEQTEQLPEVLLSSSISPETLAISPSLAASKSIILELKNNEPLTPELGEHIQALWDDAGIQATYALRSNFQLTDSAAYFFDRIPEVVSENFLPSQEDILRSRVRTTGIVESHFVIEGNKFALFDVGGQRNERKKWIHCFSEVTAVLFVAAMSEYDMVLFEDSAINRMDEAINLFEEICNSQFFKRTAMILMLNKRDLFAEKIQSVPLTVWCPDYTGVSEYQEASDFIAQAFCNRRKDPSKPIYLHYTCATDTNNMRVVFAAVKDIVIRKSLQEGGLLLY